MAPSWMQLLIVLIVALLLFGGRGRISSIMGDMAKGVRSFRKGLNDDDEEAAEPLPGLAERPLLERRGARGVP